MGFAERRAASTTVPLDRFGAARARNQRGTALPRRVGRPDLTLLLGRDPRDETAARLLADYRLRPALAAAGAPRPRLYRSRDTGVEAAAGPHGTITTIVLHFDPSTGYIPYHGEIPGGAGNVPRRTALRSMLGHPDEARGDQDRWLLASHTLLADYAPGSERLLRATLALPAWLPRAA